MTKPIGASGDNSRGGAGEATEKNDPLLHAVVKQTLEGELKLRGDELAELQAIAKRHAGQPLALEPVGREMIACLLRRRLPDLRDKAQLTWEMAEAVAQSLLENPDTFSRWDELWRRLGESQT